MSATITATGTWTSLAGAMGQDTKLNVPSIDHIDLEAQKTIYGVILPELQGFIEAAAIGWGLTFWQAAGLLEVYFKALMNAEGPTVQSSYTP